jgi:hypothetical protein
MTTENTSSPLNTFPFLSEELERMLRLRAWKDENFREALIADPKGVIQRLFPQCFPNGKVPEQLTIKVSEEDPYTCHIVVPSLPDEFPTPEIPEEEHLELFANMSIDRRPKGRDSSESQEQKSPEKPKLNVIKQHYEKKQETASEPLTREKLGKDILSSMDESKEFNNKMTNALKEVDPEKKHEHLNSIVQEKFSHYFPGGKIPEGHTINVMQDTPDTHHFVVPSSRDDFRDRGVSKDMQQPQSGSVWGCALTYTSSGSCASYYVFCRQKQ